jgi:transposase, IS5 family
LLVDSVRVLSRFVQRAKGLIKDQVHNVQQVCRSRLRTARRVAQTLHRQLRRTVEEKEAQQKELYQKLIETTEHMVHQSQQVMAALGQQTGQQARRLLCQAQEVLPLVERVIAQTRTRVLEGKKVASGQKVLSLFEPHTRAIPRHKGGALVEFGRHIILDEVEGGIVTRYQILEHPTEHGQALEAVAHHQQIFEHPPGLVAGDRGVQSAETEERLKAAGVKCVAIPAAGKLSEERQALERSRTWLCWLLGTSVQKEGTLRAICWSHSACRREAAKVESEGIHVIYYVSTFLSLRKGEARVPSSHSYQATTSSLLSHASRWYGSLDETALHLPSARNDHRPCQREV